MPSLPPLHRPKHLGPRRRAEQQRQAELGRRRGYRELKTSRWRRFRKLLMSDRAYALCICCKANGRTAGAALLDHIVPHHGDEHLIYDEANVQPLCNWCHEHIKKPIENAYAKREVTTDDLCLNRPFPEHFGVG